MFVSSCAKAGEDRMLVRPRGEIDVAAGPRLPRQLAAQHLDRRGILKRRGRLGVVAEEDRHAAAALAELGQLLPVLGRQRLRIERGRRRGSRPARGWPVATARSSPRRTAPGRVSRSSRGARASARYLGETSLRADDQHGPRRLHFDREEPHVVECQAVLADQPHRPDARRAPGRGSRTGRAANRRLRAAPTGCRGGPAWAARACRRE